jgi:hypothetical protein
MQSIITYKPSRDLLGRFKTSRRTKAKLLFVLLALTSFWLNYYLAKQTYNIKCSAGGYFTTKAQCNDMAQAKTDALELYREQMVQMNPDLFTN